MQVFMNLGVRVCSIPRGPYLGEAVIEGHVANGNVKREANSAYFMTAASNSITSDPTGKGQRITFCCAGRRRRDSDVGFFGPDRGKGGKFLILPPGYNIALASGNRTILHTFVPSPLSGDFEIILDRQIIKQQCAAALKGGRVFQCLRECKETKVIDLLQRCFGNILRGQSPGERCHARHC